MLTPSDFIKVLDESALPDNGMETVEVQGCKILLAKSNGKIYALNNACPHMGGSLGKGTLRGGQVICPLHHWTFELATGKAVLGLPGEKVAAYETKVEGGKILVKLAF